LLNRIFNEKVSSGKVLDIKCPSPTCNEMLIYHDVKYIVDKELFIKYEEFTLLAALKSDPNVKWCPNPKSCGNAIIIDPNQTNKRIRCNECGYEFCLLCNEEWHNGTCEQYQEWKIENNKGDEEFIRWSKENAKNCPNCHIRIQKVSGCNHMTCSSCSFQFCWICNGRYTSNHYDIYNPFGCPGMQFKPEDKIGVVRRIATKALIGTGIFIGGVVALGLAVPVAVIGGPIWGGYKLHKLAKKKKGR